MKRIDGCEKRKNENDSKAQLFRHFPIQFLEQKNMSKLEPLSRGASSTIFWNGKSLRLQYVPNFTPFKACTIFERIGTKCKIALLTLSIHIHSSDWLFIFVFLLVSDFSYKICIEIFFAQVRSRFKLK